MELRHLRYFCAVAESLSFSRAAEHLRVAQPALSRQVRQLENETGVTLFDRRHTPVELTDAGRVFLAHATKLLALVDIAVTAAQEAQRGNGGRLVICSDWRLTTGSVPEAVMHFRTDNPRTEVDLAELPVPEQLQALREGRIHLCFLPRDLLPPSNDFEHTLVEESDFVAVVPESHVLAKRDDVRLIELKKETWLWIDSPNIRNFRQILRQLCRLAAFTPSLGKSASTLQGVLALASSGYGITLLPGCLVSSGHPHLRIIPTDCAPFEMFAVWRREKPSAALASFLETLRFSVPGRKPRPAPRPAPATKRRGAARA